MHLLVFGKTGQVARELKKVLPEALFVGREEANLLDPTSVSAKILSVRPDAVINAAAWTAVDKAETEERDAMAVNATAPQAMALTCARRAIPFLHISTDYVFDGCGRNSFGPDHPTSPLGAYGRTKLAGEVAIRAIGAPHAILRTSWVFSAHGSNFVKSMLSLAQSRSELGIVADQVGGPTPAADIAHACSTIIQALLDDPRRAGTYHFSGAPDVSWADFAREIFKLSGKNVTVNDITTAEFPTPARRPGNSRLDCTSTEIVFGLPRPDWRLGLKQVLHDLEALA